MFTLASLSAPELAEFLAGTAMYKHPDYEWAGAHADRLRAHADGNKDLLMQLIGERYPSEPAASYEYRKRCLLEITKSDWQRLTLAIGKMRNSTQRTIDFEGTQPTTTNPKDTFKTYATELFPVYDSIEEFAFSRAFPAMLKDPNAVLAICPKRHEDPGQFPEPQAHLYSSEQVVDFIEGKYLVVKLTVKTKTGKKEVYKVFDGRDVTLLEKDKDGTRIVDTYPHGSGSLPAFRLGGLPRPRAYAAEGYDGTVLYESFFAGALPHFDYTVVLQSNQQVSYFHHVYPEYEAIEANECKTCAGGHKTYQHGLGIDHCVLKNNEYVCRDCQGTGYVAASPFLQRVLSLEAFRNLTQDGVSIPFPSKQYITKPVEILTLLGDKVTEERYRAYAALNMEFLAEVPEAQSGVAKTIDRAEANNTVATIARNFYGRVLKYTYWFVLEQRYSTFLGVSPEADMYDREQALKPYMPAIKPPTRFDIVSATMVAEELKAARDAGVSTAITQGLQFEYAAKQFDGDDYQKTLAILTIEHDPLPGLTVGEKLNICMAQPQQAIDSNLSIYITELVREALTTKDGFAELTWKEQHDELLKLAAMKMPQLEVGEVAVDGEDPAALLAKGQTELRTTVGGLQGMIDIAKAVASGVYDLEAAVALVIDRFGVTEEQARDQLGTPQLPQNEGAATLV